MSEAHGNPPIDEARENLAGSKAEFDDAVTHKLVQDAEEARRQQAREEAEKRGDDAADDQADDEAEDKADAATGAGTDNSAPPATDPEDSGEAREDQPALEEDENSPAQEGKASS